MITTKLFLKHNQKLHKNSEKRERNKNEESGGHAQTKQPMPSVYDEWWVVQDEKMLRGRVIET